jgi:tetratricopeptide (TPR) repeat protein
LDRIILWSGILLVVAVAGFGAYYSLDRQLSQPSTQEGPRIELSQYEQVVRDDPNNITNRLALADAYYRLDRYGDSIAQYEAALVINDKSALAHVGLGRAKLEVGDLAGAAQSLQAVIDQSKEEDISGTLVQSAYYYLGKIALQQQQPDEAIAQLKEATAIERSDADAWYLMGTAYIQGGQLDEAVNALTQAVLFVPGFTEAYEQLALVYDQQGTSGKALYARGMIAYSKGDLDDAAEQLEAAISASPTLGQAYSGLGLVRELQGDRDAAALAYQQALHLEPDDFNAKNGLQRLSGASAVSPDSTLPAGHPSTGDGGDSQQGVTP